jgi:hypothetical protein
MARSPRGFPPLDGAGKAPCSGRTAFGVGRECPAMPPPRRSLALGAPQTPRPLSWPLSAPAVAANRDLRQDIPPTFLTRCSDSAVPVVIASTAGRRTISPGSTFRERVPARSKGLGVLRVARNRSHAAGRLEALSVEPGRELNPLPRRPRTPALSRSLERCPKYR